MALRTLFLDQSCDYVHICFIIIYQVACVVQTSLVHIVCNKNGFKSDEKYYLNDQGVQN